MQHNPQGYRGRAVSVRRDPRVLRVLCQGGSTTYGWTVDRAVETYPAQLEEVLSESLPSGYSDVEVINAGLPWGTTAELLNHYHFKSHYYQPDAVIVHTGLNDAQAFYMEHYHPDYSHWRRQMGDGLALPAETRWLLGSRAFSALRSRPGGPAPR
jgi:lysophospholipase L1-like esterase